MDFDIVVISNVKVDGLLCLDNESDDVVKILKGNMGWYCDSIYMLVQVKGVVFMVYVVLLEGGEMGFVDMWVVFDVFVFEMWEKVEVLFVYYFFYYSQGKVGYEYKKDSEYSGYGFYGQDLFLWFFVKVYFEMS